LVRVRFRITVRFGIRVCTSVIVMDSFRAKISVRFRDSIRVIYRIKFGLCLGLQLGLGVEVV
jgi:hypothetical protein